MIINAHLSRILIFFFHVLKLNSNQPVFSEVKTKTEISFEPAMQTLGLIQLCLPDGFILNSLSSRLPSRELIANTEFTQNSLRFDVHVPPESHGNCTLTYIT